MAFPCPFRKTLGKRVVTPWIAARPEPAGEAKQHKPSELEESGAHPAPPGADRATNLVPPEPKSPPKSYKGHPGESARQPWKGRTTPRGPGESSTPH